jgi:hypothetical protein
VVGQHAAEPAPTTMKSNFWAADTAFPLVFCGGYDCHQSRLSKIKALTLASGYNCKMDLEVG